MMENVAVIGNSGVFSTVSEIWQKEIELLKQGLREKNIRLEEVNWDADEHVNWQEFNAIYIGEVGHPSTYDQFRCWCKKVKDAGVKLFNGLETLKLYTDKQRYLTLLSSLEVPIIPTHFVSTPITGPKVLQQLAHQYGLGDKLVVKPVYGTFGEENYLVDLIECDFNPSICDIKPDIIIQKFMPNVKIEGEYSFIIYDNTISHTVLKIPSILDHRTHQMHGGTSQLVSPCEDDLNAVQKVLESILMLTGEKAHKFRIDMIRCETTQTLLLLELALGDPIQYLHLLSEAQQKKAIHHFIDSTEL